MDSGLPDDEVDHNTHSSVVLHVDLDCFYAAVEHVRLGIPRDVPLAVQQWEGLIAINYAARAAGITRHERVHQAIKKCPELRCVHVETIGDESGNLDAPNRGQAKVSLERYRQASASVFKIFHRFSEICEKASIDEAYLDVTSKVEKMMDQGCNWDQELHRLIGDPEKGSEMIVVDGPLVPFNSYDRRMLAGAVIAERIRSAVRNELGYTCSVGIATNKLLAKIASAKNKPDKQTLIPPRAVSGLMQLMPLKKVKLLGGKLGEEMTKKWGVSTAGEAQALPLAALVGCFGERLGNYVWQAVRGIQADKVQVKEVAKSMLAAKSFNSTKELSDIRRWLSILAEELAVRMVRDFEQNHRHPRLLQLYYRSGDFRHSRDHTKSWAMPHAALSILSTDPSSSHHAMEVSKQDHGEDQECTSGDKWRCKADLICEEESMPFDREHHTIDNEVGQEDHSKDLLGLVVSQKSTSLARMLEDAAYNVFRRLEGTFPCSRLALAAGGFQDLPAPGTKSIQHFFTSIGKGNASSSPVQSVQKTDPTKLSSPTKAKVKVKGMLKFFKFEAPCAVQDKRRRDALEHSDDQPHADHIPDDLVISNQHGRLDHKPQAAVQKQALRALKRKSEGMYKFFGHENQCVGQEQRAGEGLHIFDTGVNKHELLPPRQLTDRYGTIEVSERGRGGRHTSAFATDLDIYQAKEQPNWNSDREEDLPEAVARGEDDEIYCHQSEFPPSALDENKTCFSTQCGKPSEKVHVGQGDEIDTKKGILATAQNSSQQQLQTQNESRDESSTPFDKSSNPGRRPTSLNSPTPDKRHRQPASKTGQQSIQRFFRAQDRT